MEGACGTHGRVKFWLKTLKENDSFEDLGVDMRIILNGSYVGWEGFGQPYGAQDRLQ
jgi:hypothetical protein